ncbi:hypothetical protein [Pedobacter frigoris]|uniref:Uncharacterized protein n=1 Tax=Pedobacter frigoris TaxID=2571272 RepID=A0A4U1CM85_9SPHI|nr:hypothetical protein [Pedobacter frigoris]TKC08544.1 hypothetical protein FA047_00125 [Pedobacter frigoris]
MNTLDLLSRRIQTLIEIGEREGGIFLTDLRQEYRRDLKQFIVGETLTVKNGKPVIGKKLYQSWLYKLKVKGFDYDIELKR